MVNPQICTAEVERAHAGVYGTERTVESCGRPAIVVLSGASAARCDRCVAGDPRIVDDIEETLAVTDSLVLATLTRIRDAAAKASNLFARSQPGDRATHIRDVLALAGMLETQVSLEGGDHAG